MHCALLGQHSITGLIGMVAGDSIHRIGGSFSATAQAVEGNLGGLCVS